jgi:hypothetical protein
MLTMVLEEQDLPVSAALAHAAAHRTLMLLLMV